MTPRPGHPAWKTPALPLLLLALFLVPCGASPQMPNLALTMEPQSPFRAVPRSFLVSLTNTTDHILRLPRLRRIDLPNADLSSPKQVYTIPAQAR